MGITFRRGAAFLARMTRRGGGNVDGRLPVQGHRGGEGESGWRVKTFSRFPKKFVRVFPQVFPNPLIPPHPQPAFGLAAGL
jgi:hypothetical protein